MQLTMIEINQIRDKYQKMAVNKWAKAGFKGSIFAGTGFGKSRVGVMAIGETLKRDSKANALILVPTTQLQYQFTEEFTKWGYEDCVDRIEVMCYQSAYKLIGEHYTIVVCDEIHLGLSIEYRKFFAHNMYDRLLCMTATLPEEDEYREKLLEIAPMVFSLSLDKCVSLGIVAPYSIYCLPVELSLLERDKYKKINNKFVYYKYALGNYDAFNQAKLALSNPQSPREEKEAAVGFYKCIRERKAIIDFAENKITKFKEIVHSNLDKRILGFGGANEFTDILTDSVSPLAVAYHSKKSKKQKQAALDAFKDGSINVLCSTKALNQGFDVPDANFGIICGITSKSLSMIQRVGRLIRFQEGKVGKIVIIYVKDSQEEKWLKNSVRQMKNVNWIAKSSDIV
tara:strand:- start:1766 stop:2959 length:1194 start_codon:yes stop_codon:yes gene_type:complete